MFEPRSVSNTSCFRKRPCWLIPLASGLTRSYLIDEPLWFSYILRADHWSWNIWRIGTTGSHRGHWRGNFPTPPTFEGKCRSSSKRKWREIRFVRIFNWNGATIGEVWAVRTPSFPRLSGWSHLKFYSKNSSVLRE
jgi:hypothetical protein